MARRPLSRAIRDGQGAVIQSATVTITVHATGLPATVYAAESGGAALAGGVTTTGTNGVFTVWVDDADYSLLTLFDVAASKANYTIATRTINA